MIINRETEPEYETSNVMKYDQRFLDKVRVWVTGGNGGTGGFAFTRENYQSRVPAGGDGGHGGDVLFQSSSRITSLHDLRRAHFKGNHGKPGLGSQRGGQNGKDKTYTIPLGTEIYEVINSMKGSKQMQNLQPEQLIKVADLDVEGDKFLAAKGGLGGFGNQTRRQIQEP